jgi:hypothetical protein
MRAYKAAPAFGPHNALTVTAAGWKGIKNGTLLTLAAGAGFEVFITTDRGYEHQQNRATLPLPVVILRARSNVLPDVLPLVPRLQTVPLAPNAGVDDHRLLRGAGCCLFAAIAAPAGILTLYASRKNSMARMTQ